MGDDRGTGRTSTVREFREANRRMLFKESDGKDKDQPTGKKKGRANTLVMRNLDQLARKYTGNKEEENSSQQLQELLDTHVGFMLFSNHLHAEYSSENIQFWEAARDFPLRPSLKECTRIVQLHVVEGSEFQINISQAVRQQVIEEAMALGTKEPDESVWKSRKDLFDLAKTEVFNLMHRDSFPRFRRSQLYLLYKKKLALQQASDARTEAKRRCENHCRHLQCGREAKHNGYCEEHTQTTGQRLAEIESSYLKDRPSLQAIMDHPLGSCFFAHHCAIEVKEAGEVRLEGGTAKEKLNPQYYYNCYKLIAEFKQTPTFNTASLCVANHLELAAPCPVEISATMRTTILGVIEPLRGVARESLSADAGTLTSTPHHRAHKEHVDLEMLQFAPPPPLDVFDEVAAVVLTSLADVYTRFLSSKLFAPCKEQMESWDSTGSASD